MDGAYEAHELVSRARGRRRRSARREAVIRRRRFVALAVAVVLVAIGTLLVVDAVRASAAASPGAGAALASIGGASVGNIRVDPSVTNDQATVDDSYRSQDLRFASGVATVSSSLVGTALVCETDVSLSDVSLLGGVVKADSVELVVTADAGRSSADADSSHSYVNGLEVNGQPVAAGAGPVTLPGVGTLTILDATVDQSRPSPSAVVTGLKLTLDQQVGDLASGTVVVAGQAAVTSDATTAAQLIRLAATSSEPTPLPAPLPTPTVKARTGTSSGGSGKSSGGGGKSSGGGGKSSAGKSGKSSAGGSGAGSSGGSGGSVANSTMPAPAAPTKAILDRFPGAVFPVRGPVNYTDTFGAYRADMPNHRHEGNDIFARMGTPIVAVLAGTIEYSTYGIGGDNARLTDARGDYFYYAHMVRFAAGLKSGDHVAKGQVIGYVGETGDAAGTSPHCHFEIHPGGGPAIDPFPYLEAWRAVALGTPAANTPVAIIAQAEVGIPLDLLLGRRGVIVGVDLGAAGAAAVAGHTIGQSDDLRRPGALGLTVCMSALFGVAVIRRLRAPALPELLAANETVVRQTVTVPERTLTNS